MMNKLTVIITFLDEGEEVENTLKSIRETAEGNVDIVLINDCSTDQYDYERISFIYNTKYIVNEVRMGVAKSREIGVSVINTSYFILIDAHMRFYTNNWHELLVKHLDEDDRALYCFACKSIDRLGNPTNSLIADGAKLSIFGNNFTSILNPDWITVDTSSHEDTIYEVPCVLGATYGMSKRYWDYIKGLLMLKYYGVDEAYLSLKVWLEGGRCLVIRNVIAGHIFRSNEQPPYNIYWIHFFYNKLIISETMLPQDYNQYVHAKLSSINNDAYMGAYALLIKERRDIVALRMYYKSIFTRDFSFFKRMNEKYIKYNDIPVVDPWSENDIREIMKQTYNYLCKSQTKSVGFGVGGIGEAVFMAKYANLYDSNELDNVKCRINELLEESKIRNYSLETGISGLVIGLIILNEFFEEFDIDELFKDVDDKLLVSLYNKIKEQDFSISTGAIGIALSVLARENNEKLHNSVNVLIKYLMAYVHQNRCNISKEILFEIAYFLVVAKRNGFQIIDLSKEIADIMLDLKLEFVDNCIVTYFLMHINEENSCSKYKNSLRKLAYCKDAVLLDVSKIGIYNGLSLLLIIFHNAYLITNDEVFNQAMLYWKQELVLRIASIVNNHANIDAVDRSYLYGISGAASTILDYIK